MDHPNQAPKCQGVAAGTIRPAACPRESVRRRMPNRSKPAAAGCKIQRVIAPHVHSVQRVIQGKGCTSDRATSCRRDLRRQRPRWRMGRSPMIHRRSQRRRPLELLLRPPRPRSRSPTAAARAQPESRRPRLTPAAPPLWSARRPPRGRFGPGMLSNHGSSLQESKASAIKA